MFIYADESGHSGKHIFNEPLVYTQGGLLCLEDLEPLFHPIVKHFCDRLSIPCLHANEIPPMTVVEIANSFMDVMVDGRWMFHATNIQKPYLATTKFVDTIFDSDENLGARWLWYNSELLRHTLCCLFDEVLTDSSKRKFWEAYLNDDFKMIQSVIGNALENLDRYASDPRLNEVAREGLDFALNYPEQITLMASKGRKSYKGHTPNMVAFSCLIQGVHSFCDVHGVTPQKFYHDSQSEFGPTMREYHKLFSGVRILESKDGMFPIFEPVDYDFGEFHVVSSKELNGLQVVDIFLWLTQRDDLEEIIPVKERLLEYTEPFYISRATSELIVQMWQTRLFRDDLKPEQEKLARTRLDKMEKDHQERLNDFLTKKSDDKIQ